MEGRTRNLLGQPLLLLGAAVLALYGRTIAFDFSYLDDNELILQVQPLLGSLSHLPQVFREDVFHSATRVYYRPLLTVSWMVDTQFGEGAAVYHFTNVLLHLVCAGLVYRLLRRLDTSSGVSLFLALLFAVHPVLTQAVAWIPGRNDSLLALFVLSSFLGLIRFGSSGRIAPCLGHLAAWVAALLTKESAVVLPLIATVYLLAFVPGRQGRRKLALLVPAWVSLGSAWFFLRAAVLKTSVPSTGIVESLAGAPGTFLIYFGKIFFPWRLSVYAIREDASLWPGAAALLVVACLLAFTFDRRQGGRYALGGAWFLLFLLPSLGKPNLAATQNLLEHRLYLPLIGLWIVFTAPDWRRLGADRRRLRPVLGAIVLAGLSALTFVHTSHFRDRMHFWKNAVETSPRSAFAHNNMGAMHYLAGDLPAAEAEWLRALALDPRAKLAHANLGALYRDRGELEAAEGEYQQEILVNPRNYKVRYNLGRLYQRQGKRAAAVEEWQKALALNPYYVDAYSDIITDSMSNGDRAMAERYLALMREKGIPIPPELSKKNGE